MSTNFHGFIIPDKMSGKAKTILKVLRQKGIVLLHFNDRASSVAAELRQLAGQEFEIVQESWWHEDGGLQVPPFQMIVLLLDHPPMTF